MALSTTDSLLEALEKSSLLDAEQLAQVRQIAPQAGDARTLAKKLVAMGLLTRWQSDLLLAGRTTFLVGKYKLMELLGRGGMGNVFLARHTMMNRPVALKIISKQLGRDPANLERFFSEARAVAALNHPNIVHAYNIDNEGDRYYMVMEFVEGLDLQQTVEQNGPLDCALAAEYVRQAADGLAHAHQRNIVHCDIKPANLLVNSQGVVKILDMGMARLVSTEVENDAALERVLGTVDYMAPELAMQSPNVDRRVDVYSLGCTLYFLLTGHPPFPEGTLTQKIVKHQMEQPQSILEQRPDVPHDLVEICQKMMAKKPEDRYQSAEEVLARLAELSLTETRLPREEELSLREEELSLREEDLSPREEELLLRAEPLEEKPKTPAPVAVPEADRPAPAEIPDPLSPADDLLAAGGLAFPEEALPPAPTVIPAPSSSSKRPTKSRQPTMVLVAGGLALVVLIAVIGIVILSTNNGSHTPGSESSLAKVSPPATSKKPPDPAKVSSSNDPPAKAPQTPPAKADAPKGKDKNAERAERAQKKKQEIQERAAVFAAKKAEAEKAAAEKVAAAKEKASRGPAQRKKVSKPPPGLPPAENPVNGNATPVAEPVEAPAPANPGPLAGIPPVADLPLVSDQGESPEPVTLGRIETPPEVQWQLELLGGDTVLAEGRRYVLQRVAGEPATASWLIRHESPVPGVKMPLGLDVARLWRDKGTALMFQWAPKVKPEVANYLRNCLLRIRVQDAVCDLGLLMPQPIDPLALSVDRIVLHSPFELKWAPPGDKLKVQVAKVDGPQPHRLAVEIPRDGGTEENDFEVQITESDSSEPRKLKLRPTETVGFGVPVYLVYLRKDASGGDILGVLFKAVFQEKGGNYAAHLTLQQPKMTVFHRIKNYVSQTRSEGVATTRKQLVDRANVEKQRTAKDSEAKRDLPKPAIRSSGHRQPVEKKLSPPDANLWYLDFYEAMQSSAFMQFRVFIEIGDKQVVLASTEVSQPVEAGEAVEPGEAKPAP